MCFFFSFTFSKNVQGKKSNDALLTFTQLSFNVKAVLSHMYENADSRFVRHLLKIFPLRLHPDTKEKNL